MNLAHNGVSALQMSSRSQLIYVGGNDGSIMVFQQGSPLFVKSVSYFGTKLQDESNLTDYDKIKDYKTVLKEEQEAAMS